MKHNCVLQVYFWDYAQQNSQSSLRGAASAGAMVEPVLFGPKIACNSLALEWLPQTRSAVDSLQLVSAYEDGSVMHQQAE